jgi:hypothetical protein
MAGKISMKTQNPMSNFLGSFLEETSEVRGA